MQMGNNLAIWRKNVALTPTFFLVCFCFCLELAVCCKLGSLSVDWTKLTIVFLFLYKAKNSKRTTGPSVRRLEDNTDSAWAISELQKPPIGWEALLRRESLQTEGGVRGHIALVNRVAREVHKFQSSLWGIKFLALKLPFRSHTSASAGQPSSYTQHLRSSKSQIYMYINRDLLQIIKMADYMYIVGIL